MHNYLIIVADEIICETERDEWRRWRRWRGAKTNNNNLTYNIYNNKLILYYIRANKFVHAEQYGELQE